MDEDRLLISFTVFEKVELIAENKAASKLCSYHRTLLPKTLNHRCWHVLELWEALDPTNSALECPVPID